jgi:hypothetical protein
MLWVLLLHVCLAHAALTKNHVPALCAQMPDMPHTQQIFAIMLVPGTAATGFGPGTAHLPI